MSTRNLVEWLRELPLRRRCPAPHPKIQTLQATMSAAGFSQPGGAGGGKKAVHVKVGLSLISLVDWCIGGG